MIGHETDSRLSGMDGETRTRKAAARKPAARKSASAGPAEGATAGAAAGRTAGRTAGRRVRPTEPSPADVPVCTTGERLGVLGSAPFFSRLSPPELEQVNALFEQASYAAGQAIHSAGEPARKLSIVAAGKVRIAHPTAGGQDARLALLGPGEPFGSLPELGDATYRDAAYAHTGCCVLSISAESFHDLLQRYPALAMAALERTAARLRVAQETLEQISAVPADRRIAATLLALADLAGRAEVGTTVIDTELSRKDLAAMTGASVDTVGRVLAEFRRDGLIDTGRRWISVRDPVRLARVAHGTHA
ncbi:MAG: Crp/Fnr family transcriptional regulator [Burkholderiaceae bacterium]|nr:Crp/Fnr family transcriptional regulator [Burkholderiaceae bacterium]